MPEVRLYFPMLDFVMPWSCQTEERVFRLLWEVCNEELGEGEYMPIAINKTCVLCDAESDACGLCVEHYTKFEQWTRGRAA